MNVTMVLLQGYETPLSVAAALTFTSSGLTFTSVAPPDSRMQVAIESLYPALLQTFLCILLGYSAGRAGIISSVQSAGVGAYVSRFALPALLFQNMATLDWSTVEWTFVACVGLAKLSVYVAALIVGLLVTRPMNFASAAMCAIFVSQSNDFALGYPIVKAMYRRSHPEFVQYIYLLAPLSLCILNPVAFALIEFQKRRSPEEGTADGNVPQRWTCVPGLRICGMVLKGVLLNPAVLFTGIGLAANFIFRHQLPVAIQQFVEVLGQSFSATALFYLGLSIVGKLGADLSRSLLVCSLLIAVKLVVFPFITMEYARLLNCGSDSNSTADYAMFGFLFGTIPTAPSVFVYATHYGILTDLVAAGMVLCTIVSAPLMFISAIMVSMKFFTMDYLRILHTAAFDVAVLSAVCVPWVTVVFLVTKRLSQMPHILSTCLAACQLLVAVGVLSSRAISNESSSALSEVVPLVAGGDWQDYVSFVIYGYGLLGSYVFTAVLSVSLALLTRRGMSRVLRDRRHLLLAGFAITLLLIIIMMLSVCVQPGRRAEDQSAVLGRAQYFIHTSVLVVSVATTVVFMVLRHRWEQQTVSLQVAATVETSGREPASTESSYGHCEEDGRNGSLSACDNDDVEIEDGFGECVRLLTIQRNSEQQPEERLESSLPAHRGNDNRTQTTGGGTPAMDGTTDVVCSPQLKRHFVLLVLLLLVMTSSIYVSICKLVNPDMLTSGVYIELVFMDAVLNIGQGVFTFAVFGLDSQFVLLPLWMRIVTVAGSLRRLFCKHSARARRLCCDRRSL